MIECVSCHTLNPDAERACLACGAVLSRPSQTGSATLGMARCPAGHPIDPAWKSCPYCDRQTAGGSPPSRSTRLDGAAVPEPPAAARRTRLESDDGPGAGRKTRLEGEEPWPAPPPPPPSPSGPRPTRLESDEPPSGRRTVFQDSSTVSFSPPAPPEPPPSPAPVDIAGFAPQAAGSGAPARRLIAVLAAPDLGPGGTVFAVRGGKNTIGAARTNDVVLSADTGVSGEHAVILHRNGTFHLADRLSTNGTWVNGQEVPANGTVPLNDRDRIRCGRTEMVFLVVESAESSPAGLGSE